MRIGLLARADDGGLGTMTWEFARHLNPDRALIVDLGPQGRGRPVLERFTDHCDNVGVTNSYPGFDESAIRWLLNGIDVLYTAETWYWPAVQVMAAAAGVKTVLHSMPELHNPSLVADQIWVPTQWEINRIPGARHMPVPVALDRFPVIESTSAKRFLHIKAPAFHDRNGTEIVEAAVQYVKKGEIVFAPPAQNYWDMTQGGDVLVYPRRYAGLSLPMQEAMARGMPIITTDLSPQNAWPGVMTVPAVSPHDVDMKGGTFKVWNADPYALARAIDLMVEEDGTFQDLSEGARYHAESISWNRMRAVYLEALEAVLA